MNTDLNRPEMVKHIAEKPKTIERTFCRDVLSDDPASCGNSIETARLGEWQRGEITGRHRCPECVRRLEAVAKIGSEPMNGIDAAQL